MYKSPFETLFFVSIYPNSSDCILLHLHFLSKYFADVFSDSLFFFLRANKRKEKRRKWEGGHKGRADQHNNHNLQQKDVMKDMKEKESERLRQETHTSMSLSQTETHTFRHRLGVSDM